jgi:hypothetical protein
MSARLFPKRFGQGQGQGRGVPETNPAPGLVAIVSVPKVDIEFRMKQVIHAKTSPVQNAGRRCSGNEGL